MRYPFLFSGGLAWSNNQEKNEENFTNDFVMEFEGNRTFLEHIATLYEMEIKSEVFPGHWHLRSSRHTSRVRRDTDLHRHRIHKLCNITEP